MRGISFSIVSRLVRFFRRFVGVVLALWRRRAVRAALLFLLALWVFDHGVTLVTDSQWQDSIGFGAAYRTRLFAGVMLFGGVLLSALLLLLGTLRALHHTPKTEIALPLLYVSLQSWLETFERVCARLACLVIGLEALRQARFLAGQRDQWLLFRHASVVGRRDPFFGLDADFYQFRLPFLHALLDVAARLTLDVLLVSLVLLAGRGVVRWVSPRPELPRALARWCLGLGAALFGLRGLNYALWPLDLMTAQHPDALVSAGMTFVDWNVRRPLGWLGIALCALMILLLLAQMFKLKAPRVEVLPRAPQRIGRRWIVCGLSAWLLPGFLNGWLPGLVERLVVAPDAFRHERPFLQAQGQATRQAWGLDRIAPAPLAGAFDSADVRLWDSARLGAVVLSQARADELVSAPQLDRYDVNGKRMLVGIAAHEPHAAENLEWVNRHASSQARSEGALIFDAASSVQASAPFLSLPSTTPIASRLRDLTARHPLREARVFHGADAADYALLDDDAAGGVALTSVWRRALWAWRLRDMNLLLRSTSGKPHLLLRPAMSERAKVLPFLVPDGEPCAVIAEGRLVWLMSLLSVTPNAPMTALDPFKPAFLGVPHDSVKMTMDAVTGRLAFYVSSAREESEPSLQAWRRAFPDLIQNAAALPAELRAHRRYPRGLFAAQMRMLQRYQAAPQGDGRNATWRLARAPLSAANTLEVANPDYVLLPPLLPLNRDAKQAARAAFGLQEVLLSPQGARDAALQIVRVDCDGDHYGQFSASQFALTPQAARAATNVLAEKAVNAKESETFGAPVVMAASQKSGSGPVLAWQPVFKTTSSGTPLVEAAPDTLSGVVVRDLLSEGAPGFGPNAQSALELWRKHSAGQEARAPEVETTEDLARQALRLHDGAQRAASGREADGWQRAGQLWQQEREVLRRLAERQKNR